MGPAPGASSLVEATLCTDTCETQNAMRGLSKEKSSSREGAWPGVVGRRDFSKEEAQPWGLEGWGGSGLGNLGTHSGIRAELTAGLHMSLSVEF